MTSGSAITTARAPGWEASRSIPLTRRLGTGLFLWWRGRVALVGDAGYAPGAGVGGGTSLAVVTAYVLARELASAGGDHAAGFRNYEDEIRETVVRSRDIGPALLKTLIPTSRAQIWLGMQVARLLPRLPKRLKRSVSLFPREAIQGMRSIASLPLEDD